MQRYFVSSEDVKGNIVTIQGDDRHHMANVMRFQPGDKVIICQPDESTHIGAIEHIHVEEITITLLEELDEQKELPITVTVAQGMPKGDKLELIAQKGTELGMHALLPVQMDRSIVKWDGKKEAKKRARLEKIVKEASEQSHRTIIPNILPLISLRELDLQQYDYCLIANETEAKQADHSSTFREVLGKINKNDQILVIIGPEGGFSEKELAFLNHDHVYSIRLGKRILRTETAPLYVLAALSFYFEEWS
ncbi:MULTISPECIES: 16S rRNA (uracil(1498)-N(3))-methyltransferase [Allobacillus]|uniref:Ribosomal RNA small subunit methyltransferase E n=1 Tax=Allobacillus salarius TaxID=1955272 RepID=A0A556PTP5_9BACI|nr:16S rRNA (uracil(1498)-N(3))-methyltransferase [Allobacillus salarius]TSJ67754.1 16S rRNA (uracil(1498)-N(3))-methyltransferase [Allobacillus salarius]